MKTQVTFDLEFQVHIIISEVNIFALQIFLKEEFGIQEDITLEMKLFIYVLMTHHGMKRWEE